MKRPVRTGTPGVVVRVGEKTALTRLCRRLLRSFTLTSSPAHVRRPFMQRGRESLSFNLRPRNRPMSASDSITGVGSTRQPCASGRLPSPSTLKQQRRYDKQRGEKRIEHEDAHYTWGLI